MRHTTPFHHVRLAPALRPDFAGVLRGLALGPGDWQRRDAGFYRCSLRDVTAALPAPRLCELAARVASLLDTPLTDHVQVTVQRMDPGDRIGPHSDRPLVGYESARLVVFLNPGWAPGDGGTLQLFAAPGAPPAATVAPEHNTGFAFTLHPGSHHAVTTAHRARLSAVFNFWHPGNPPALAAAVADLFGQARFGALPTGLDRWMTEAEATLPEAVSWRAGMTAWALHQWGADADQVIQGYRYSAWGTGDAPPATHLAHWLAGLADGAFDLDGWAALSAQLAGVPAPPGLGPLWGLALAT